MRSITILLFASVALASLASDRSLFTEFMRKYKRSYSAVEMKQRFAIFQENLRISEKHQQANPSASFGVTKFMDMSANEFRDSYLSNISMPKTKLPYKTEFSHDPSASCSPNPTNFNWGSCGVTTPVYNQGQCGSCWAFSATETIESYYALGGNTLTKFSMEQIVDCDHTDDGCNGGLPTNAYNYVQQAGGIEPYSDYPYTAENGVSGQCKFSKSKVVATVTGQQAINGEQGLYKQTSSSSGGPVSVCVDATTWQTYQGGVITSCPNQIDHCVQLIGYAKYGQNGAYWIVRNSWGTDWGEQGFIWVAIGQDLCGIGDQATIASVKAVGPSPNPSGNPTGSPSNAPTAGPSGAPTAGPTAGPSGAPTAGPSGGPTAAPSGGPTVGPSGAPTAGPSGGPTAAPSGGPTAAPSGGPTVGPSGAPTASVQPTHGENF